MTEYVRIRCSACGLTRDIPAQYVGNPHAQCACGKTGTIQAVQYVDKPIYKEAKRT